VDWRKARGPDQPPARHVLESKPLDRGKGFFERLLDFFISRLHHPKVRQAPLRIHLLLGLDRVALVRIQRLSGLHAQGLLSLRSPS